jgi:hypothetical protein
MIRFQVDPLAALAAGAPPLPPTGVAGAGRPGAPDNAAAEAALNAMIDAAHTFLRNEEDDQDKAIITQCLHQAQKLLGTRQKQQEAALGVTDVHRGVRRAIKRGRAGY